jgi:type VI secretion system protein ImpL
VELYNEPGEQGLKKMIDTAAKARKDANVHELRWSAGNVTVAVELRIASNAERAPESRRGFAGMQLPETFAGKSPVRGTVASAGGAQ